MQGEFDKLRAKWDKAVEQGKKIEQLTNQDEWRFLEGYLKATADELADRVMRGEFLNNMRVEDFNKGVITGLRMVIESTVQFKKAKETAETAAKKYREADDE